MRCCPARCGCQLPHGAGGLEGVHVFEGRIFFTGPQTPTFLALGIWPSGVFGRPRFSLGQLGTCAFAQRAVQGGRFHSRPEWPDPIDPRLPVLQRVAP